jgi:hypothetical protein
VGTLLKTGGAEHWAAVESGACKKARKQRRKIKKDTGLFTRARTGNASRVLVIQFVLV